MTIRMLEPTDHEQWLPLWKAYQAFYQVDIWDEVTRLTWQRLLDPDEPMHCAVAAVDGALIEHVYAKAEENGAARVWWLTHESNHTAIHLYDHLADKSGFVQYRKVMP